ncbi:response regulator [Desulfatibacillum aliphaticivorans]|nr:response regulator [Desulfatibacillum aliphaticivorans]
MNVQSHDIADKERILIVDDEPQVLKVMKRMLEFSGYTVTAMENSVEALQTFGEAPDSFNAVFTDMCMPQMNGDVLSSRMKEIRPDIPIILCTGYSELFSEEKAREAGLAGYLQKPIYHKQMVETLRQALNCPK